MLLPQEFAEAKIATKYAQFDIRVYPDSAGKETIIQERKVQDDSA